MPSNSQPVNSSLPPDLLPIAKGKAIPVEMFILTADHEVVGMVYVNPSVKSERRVSELLNNTSRRFLALTDVRLVSRNGNSTARLYPFLQLHIDSIILIHPASQSILKSNHYTPNDANRFNGLRDKIQPLLPEL